MWVSSLLPTAILCRNLKQFFILKWQNLCSLNCHVKIKCQLKTLENYRLNFLHSVNYVGGSKSFHIKIKSRFFLSFCYSRVNCCSDPDLLIATVVSTLWKIYKMHFHRLARSLSLCCWSRLFIFNMNFTCCIVHFLHWKYCTFAVSSALVHRYFPFSDIERLSDPTKHERAECVTWEYCIIRRLSHQTRLQLQIRVLRTFFTVENSIQ